MLAQTQHPLPQVTHTPPSLCPESSRALLVNIEIPPQPEIVRALMRERLSDSPEIERIVELIMRDAALTAAVLKAANSPYYGLRTKVSSISQCVTVLGMKNLGTLVMGLALRNSVNVEGMDQFLEHARRSARLATLLARRMAISTSIEEIQMYGLFHDAAIPVLMKHLPGYRQTVEAHALTSWADITELENNQHKIDHALVGGALAEDWGLPDNVVTAIKRHHDTQIFYDASLNTHVLNLIALGHIAEGVERAISLGQTNYEWEIYNRSCLHHVGMDYMEWIEFTDAARDFLEQPG